MVNWINWDKLKDLVAEKEDCDFDMYTVLTKCGSVGCIAGYASTLCDNEGEFALEAGSKFLGIRYTDSAVFRDLNHSQAGLFFFGGGRDCNQKYWTAKARGLYRNGQRKEGIQLAMANFEKIHRKTK